jgi:hypothetical protein
MAATVTKPSLMRPISPRLARWAAYTAPAVSSKTMRTRSKKTRPAGVSATDLFVRTKELDANLALKPTDFVTEMGLCNAQPHRRSREVELLGDRDKKFQMSMFHRCLI